MQHAIKFIRWAPVAYYVFAVAWGSIIGGLELSEVAMYCGQAGSLVCLAAGAEMGIKLVTEEP
jgi:hypothetical protein